MRSRGPTFTRSFRTERTSPRCRQGGFTLLEVLVAISLFAIIAVGMTSSTIGTIQLNNYSRRSSEALALIEQKLEEFRTLSGEEIADLLPATNTDGYVDGSDGVLSATGDAMVADVNGNTIGGYTRTWKLERVDGSYTMFQATVTVTWNNPTEQSVSNVAYFCASSSC